MDAMKFIPISIIFVSIYDTISSDVGWFWHVTDFHYDFTYNGSRLSCNKKNLTHLGKYGNFWCDSPWALVSSSVNAMKNIKSDVDFLIWTGDTVLHGTDEELTTEINDRLIGNLTDLLRDSFPGKSVYASFGNHDYWPNNQFPPQNNLLYNLTLARWRAWINEPSQEAHFRKGGYYTVVLLSGLRLLALNTNLYYSYNQASLNETDPAGQFDWLEAVLDTSRTKKSKGNPIISVFMAPSVTPWKHNISGKTTTPNHNPAVRLVKYERQTGNVVDILQYYLDLPSANRQQHAKWQLEYTATSDYNVPDLRPTSLYQLITRMKVAHSEELSNFIKWYTVSSPGMSCDTDCKTSILCSFTNFNMTAFKKCTSTFVFHRISKTTSPISCVLLSLSICFFTFVVLDCVRRFFGFGKLFRHIFGLWVINESRVVR